MCNVMSFATNMSFVTCLMQLDTIVVACDIYKLKLIVNAIVSTQFFSSDLWLHDKMGLKLPYDLGVQTW
jgi:hypothetical protein